MRVNLSTQGVQLIFLCFQLLYISFINKRTYPFQHGIKGVNQLSDFIIPVGDNQQLMLLDVCQGNFAYHPGQLSEGGKDRVNGKKGEQEKYGETECYQKE